MAEVRAEREGSAVDARLRFTVDERLPAETLVPPEAFGEAYHRRCDVRIRAIDTGRTEQLHREEGRQPVVFAGAMPWAVGALTRENLRAEPFVRDARALRGNRRR
jgi:hypothetical protein